MDFSLSSSLVGSAVSNPDKLALDLQFAADKTLTARKGPTPAFTRGSSATQVGDSGLIEYAPENLYNQSQNFAEAFWTKARSSIQADSAIAPDGTLTADKFIEDTSITNTHSIGSNVTPTLIPYVLSTFAKKGERNWIVLRLGAVNTFFNLDSGTFVASTNPAAITDVGNGWYRCSVRSSAGTQGSFQLSADGITSSYTGDGTSGIFIWGAQLERSSTVRTYIPTTTAPVYGPRFDHDPVTLACKGLLIEESRTNTLLQSEAFDSASWANAGSNLTVTANAIAAPNGLLTADTLTVGATTMTYAIISGPTPSLVSGTAYTVSCFFKANQVTRVSLYSTTAGTFPANAIFDLTGSGSVVQNTFGAASITPYPNGWYRCQITGTAGASVPTTLRISPATGTSLNYVGNSIDSFYAWGAQLELGSFPTSYIPTTTSSVIRSADVCSITGSAFTSIWNGVDATVFFRGSRIANIVGQTNWAVGSGTIATSIISDRTASFERLAGAGSAIINRALFTTLQEYKTATALKAGDYAISFNGETVLTSTNTFALSLNVFAIGTGYTGGGQLNGWVNSIKFYKKRLPNAKLTQLTT